MHLAGTQAFISAATHHPTASVVQVYHESDCRLSYRTASLLRATPSSEPRPSLRRYGPFFGSCPAVHCNPPLHRFFTSSSPAGLGSNDISDIHANRRCKSQQQHLPFNTFGHTLCSCCSALHQTFTKIITAPKHGLMMCSNLCREPHTAQDRTVKGPAVMGLTWQTQTACPGAVA